MTKIVMWRHGQSVANRDGIYQGQLDSPLDELGRVQAERGSRVIAGFDPVAIYSSDLRRARSTAEPLSRLTRIPVTYDRRLRELLAGKWQGLTRDEIDREFPEEVRLVGSGVDVARGGGERPSEVAARLNAVVEEAVTANPVGTIVLVSHSVALKYLLCSMLEIPDPTWLGVSSPSNGNWSVCVRSHEHWCLTQHNVDRVDDNFGAYADDLLDP